MELCAEISPRLLYAIIIVVLVLKFINFFLDSLGGVVGGRYRPDVLPARYSTNLIITYLLLSLCTSLR
jgi:hypothetical protein